METLVLIELGLKRSFSTRTPLLNPPGIEALLIIDKGKSIKILINSSTCLKDADRPVCPIHGRIYLWRIGQQRSKDGSLRHANNISEITDSFNAINGRAPE